ncbi:hypothetical protein B0A55_12101 [Friedmanniomyces simplex]|uniref:RING-type domain-containing protein n=1 Tax=Friedmanniomyces simplex TaxID=329884 RepID=A0A4U0WHI6_9PEZI|nr:hypothetical protein B0A55_12101 [Friedmanniomyces simplex]
MVKFNPQALIAHSVNGSTSLTAVAPGQSESYRVPSAVLDNVGGHAQPSLPLAVENFTIPPASSGFEPLYRATKKPLVPGVHYETFDSANLLSDGARMKPVSIAQLRAERGSFAKTSKQLQKRRRVTSSLSIARGSAAAAAADAPASPATPASRATTSSLELPKTWDDNDDDESPMPFLSPGIPARKPSPNTAPRIEESTDLPSLQSTSFESLPSTVGQDSDSDDETFTGGMRNSSTFMPGGINVPLPKACGALFAPNGQLLTFFPPKPRPPSIASNRAPPEERADHRSHTRRIAQLFPVFGNLTAVREMPGDGTDDEQDIDEYDPDLSSVDHELPSFAMHPSSFQSQSRWSTHASPTKPAFNAQDVHRILVSVHEVDELTPSRRAAAYGYRNICKRGETKSNLCRHNADVAESVGLEDTAIVWRLMALLLEEKVPLSTVGAAGPDMDVLFVARQATSLLQAKPSIDPIEEQAEQHGKLRWADSPLGAAFLVRKCFQWAERRADVQLLALLSAVFIEAEDKVPLRSSTASHSMLARLPTHVDRIFPGSMMDSTAPEARPIPLLRNESNPSSLVYASPTQLRHCSQASSRTPSQPPTPHIGSASSTPPLSLPSFSRESSKFSGSASPEHHRSSFSAAARHYAQSITDKFASYGTSPPLKTSTSPSFNELSTSLSAAAAGSWSKSVSFASTASTTRDSQLNRSYTSQDLDGYDSDKTIDDTSLPHTPKLGLGPVVLHLPNSDMFTNDVAGGSTTLPLMPSDLAAKATSWRAHYAEQLRCWGLWMQAAELEKAAGMTLSDSGHSSPLAVGFIPVPKQRKATCSICFAVITRLAQICSACSHTTHVDCLDDYIATLEDDETFECPTGCGCACDRLPYEPIELTLEKDIVNDVQKTVRRKVSYTDPRRWRARVEGESW